ncbi:hypothetical protein K2Z84_00770 [Candidatus Binatia bacterium]|nr:hypothetical protein [Candidatus Binatia bacterium]
MRSMRVLSAAGVLFLAAAVVPRAAHAQILYDHQECYPIKDLRNIPPNVPVSLTPLQIAFFSANTGCQLLPLAKPKAKKLCVMADKNPAHAPFGPPLQVDYLCYRARCNPSTSSQPTFNATDQFGSGPITALQRGRTREVCVPATMPGLPTPTPVPTPPACVTPTPPYGSASLAFVRLVASLLD